MIDATSLVDVIDDFVSKYDRIVTSALVYRRLADLRADSTYTADLADGTLVMVLEPQLFLLETASSGATHYTAASGKTFKVVGDRVTPLMFEAAADGQTNDKARIDLALSSGASELDLMGRTYRYVGSFNPAIPVFNGVVIDDLITHDFGLMTRKDVATAAEALAGAPAGKLPTIGDVATIVGAALVAQGARNIVQTAFTGITIYPSAAQQTVAELTTTITTTNANSYVRVDLTMHYERRANGSFNILRNGTPIFQNDAASPGNRNIGIAPVEHEPYLTWPWRTLSLSFIDQVGAAGNYTYEVQASGEEERLSINRGYTDSDDATKARSTSFMLLEEISVGGGA